MMLVNMARNMLMHTDLRCPKDRISTDFIQQKWTILYDYTVGSLLCSMVYKILVNGQE